MKNRYSVYWFFGALIFFFLGAVFTVNLAELYFNGYISEIRNIPFRIELLWICIGVCLIMATVCLAFTQPLDLQNYCTRLERENAGLKKALECYEADAEHAARYHLAEKALKRCGHLGDAKIKYLDEEKTG